MRTWEIETKLSTRVVHAEDWLDLEDVQLTVDDGVVVGERMRSPMTDPHRKMLEYLAWVSDVRDMAGREPWMNTTVICDHYCPSVGRRTVRYRLHSLRRRGYIEKVPGIPPTPSAWRITHRGREAVSPAPDS
ncbi:MAG: hypothetical protein V3T22_10400 [Planctomycetota bacterium]